MLGSILMPRLSLLVCVAGMRHGDGILHYADAMFSDVGYTIKAGFMFDEPRVPSRMTKVSSLALPLSRSLFRSLA